MLSASQGGGIILPPWYLDLVYFPESLALFCKVHATN